MEKLKKIGVVFMLGLLIIKALINPIIYTDFQIRKDFIVKNYCINKDRPELKCDGKCYLAKMLKQADQQDQHQGDQRFIAELYSFECLDSFFDSYNFNRFWGELERNPNFQYLGLYSLDFKTSTFHPPQFTELV